MKLKTRLFSSILIFIATTWLCSGQSLVDSLLQSLEGINDEKILVSKQINASLQMYRINKLLSDSLLETSLKLAKQLESKELEFKAKWIKGNRMKNGDEKIRFFSDLDALVESSEISPKLALDIKISHAKALFAKRYAEESAEIYKEAIAIAEKHRLQPLGHLHISISSPLAHKGDHFVAMKYLQRALEIPGDHHGRAYSAIPNICRKVQDWDNMIKYGKIGLEDAIKVKSTRREIFSLMQLSYAYMQIEDYEQARTYGEEAWKISKENNFFQRAGILLSTLINTELKSGNVDKALSYESVIDVGSSVATPSTYGYLGLAKLEKGRVKDAISDCNKVLTSIDYELEQAYDIALYKMEANDCLQMAYKQAGNYEKAYEAQSEYLKAKEIVEGKKTFIDIGRALNQQELAQQKNVLQIANEKNELLYKERIKKYRLTGVLSLLILLVGAYSIFQMKKRNKLITAQNHLIQKGLREKDLLLKEIHHRVKNNLQLVSSLLSLQGKSINDVAAKNAIKEGQSRIRSMALIHQNLYNKDDLKGVNVKRYVEMLVEDLLQTYRVSKENIDLKMEIQDIQLDIDTLVPLGLIMNELVTNSLKYAFPEGEKGSIEVSLNEEDGALHLTIADNGVGYDPKKVRGNAFGETLIATLTEQLDGEISYSFENGVSTHIEISNYS